MKEATWPNSSSEPSLDTFARTLRKILHPDNVSAAFGNNIGYTLQSTEAFAVTAVEQITLSFPTAMTSPAEVEHRSQLYRSSLRSKDFIVSFCSRLSLQTSRFRRQARESICTLALSPPLAVPSPRTDREGGAAFRARRTRTKGAQFTFVSTLARVSQFVLSFGRQL